MKITARELRMLGKAADLAIADLTKKPSKYRNRKVVKNGETFDSVREYERHLALRDMQKRGEIVGLKRQPVVRLVVCGSPICKYIPDWEYFDPKIQRYVYEDAKGTQTPEFKLKWKLAQAILPGFVWRLS